MDDIKDIENIESGEGSEMKSRRVLRVKKKPERTARYYIGEGIRKVIMVTALFAFSYASYAMTNRYLDYKDADNAYADVNDLMGGIGGVNLIVGDGSNEDGSGISLDNHNESDKWEWDYDSYMRFNSDTRGFISCEGTPINYPIMQGKDNEYYLNHLANNIVNLNGSIFIDYKIDMGLEARNCIIYGHNMRNDSMFGSLQNYAEESYWEEHPTMDIYVGYDHYKYHVFAAYSSEVGTDTFTIRFKDDKSFLRYIKASRGKSIYSPDVGEITADDKIVTLVTCMDSNDKRYRFIVQLVRREKVND